MQTVDQLLKRALSMVGQSTVYWAGSGGMDPLALSPTERLAVGKKWPTLPAADKARFLPMANAADLDVEDPDLVVAACDCSGFVCWALGFSRKVGVDQWINTDAMHDDARDAHRKFTAIGAPRLGCLVVYPKLGSNETYGHVGIVTQLDQAGKATKVVHCSADNFQASPCDAIKETDLRKFERQARSIFAWSHDVQ